MPRETHTKKKPIQFWILVFFFFDATLGKTTLRHLGFFLQRGREKENGRKNNVVGFVGFDADWDCDFYYLGHCQWNVFFQVQHLNVHVHVHIIHIHIHIQVHIYQHQNVDKSWNAAGHPDQSAVFEMAASAAARLGPSAAGIQLHDNVQK